MRGLIHVFFLIVVGLFPIGASADEMVAIKPGLMCVSADALAKLTLPDGSSAAAKPGAASSTSAIKRSGGCLDVVPGDRVTLVTRRTNTSVVQGLGARQGTFLVPNIDFQMEVLQAPNVVQMVTALGGSVVYYITATRHDDEGINFTTIRATHDENRSRQILVKDHVDYHDLSKNLHGLHNLYLSPDGKRLFFQADAWATSDAIHTFDLETGQESYLTPGSIACVVLAGEWQGDIIASQHRYFVQGGSYDDLRLYSLTGKELGLVAEGTDSRDVCPVLRR